MSEGKMAVDVSEEAVAGISHILLHLIPSLEAIEVAGHTLTELRRLLTEKEQAQESLVNFTISHQERVRRSEEAPKTAAEIVSAFIQQEDRSDD